VVSAAPPVSCFLLEVSQYADPHLARTTAPPCSFTAITPGLNIFTLDRSREGGPLSSEALGYLIDAFFFPHSVPIVLYLVEPYSWLVFRVFRPPPASFFHPAAGCTFQKLWRMIWVFSFPAFGSVATFPTTAGRLLADRSLIRLASSLKVLVGSLFAKVLFSGPAF